VPAALPQARAQVPAKAALHPGAEAQGPIGQAPFKASGAPVSIDPAERKPALDLQALASRTLDGAPRALRGTLQRVAIAPAPPAVAATALTASPQPALDAAAPDTEALAATEANPAPKNSAQSAAPALLQAIPAGPGAVLKGTRGTEEPAPGPVAKTAPSLAAEPTPGEPLVPAALPQQLAPLPAKAALQPGTEAQGPSGQAPLKAGGAPVSLELAETKPAPDLLALANRTLDGAALAPGTPQRAPEGLTAPAPAAAPPPSQPAAAPPSAPVLQVEGGLRWMLKSGAQEAQLQLHPDALGQVTIHLKVEGGEVHAKVWVSEAASVLAVKEGQPHLEQALKEQGLHLGSFDLQQGHRPFQEAPSAPMLRERGLAETVVARQEAPAPPPVAILNPHHVELYA
jgi:flagellar hook-length control protein FliK